MGQASITVDILAKIKGWQEELAKLKAAAAKVDLGSSFGKDLTRVMKSLETQIDSMGKNMSQRLTSDSGIDSFVTKLDNVDQRFKSIGESLTTVTFDQLDPSYVTEELKDLNTQLENAKIALESANKASFNNVVGSVSSVRIALTRMGEDITKISMDEAISKLTTGIADLDTKINQATEDLRSMRAQRDQLLNEQKTLNSSPLFNITDMAQKVSEIIGSQSDYAIQKVNTQRINDYIAELKSTLTAAGVEISEETSAINEAFNQLAGSKTAGEIRTNLINLRRVVKENSDLTSDAALNRVNLGGVATKIKEWMTDNEAALNEAKAHLQTKIEELQISPDKAKTIVDSFVSTIKSGGWEAGKQALEQQLNDYKTTIMSRRSEIETELNNLKTLISNTDTQVKRDQYTRGVAQEASTKGWDELIAKLTAENQKLADRVTNLERALQQKMDSVLSNVTGTGKNTIGSAEQGFRDNAAAAKMYKTELEQVQAHEQMIGKIEGVVQRWFSIYTAVRMVTNAIKSIISTVKELDTTITEIAIVTKMDQSQLWGQMESYTSLAREYAASISGVYKVSQLYYQQGLQTSDVMALTKQTLKMARISGLNYAEATDYMTNAVRSFKMEMTEAQTIVDVYSAIAASSATDTTELASAMSKTASSAEAVGSSFENTTAMMAVMIEATRESAENIGSAMKSIISRYGEMTSDPSKLVDSEGQEMSLNRVDKALQTIGITIHDTMGEFRDFDDVIMELASKWDTIDKNTQRYIATIMAGNRQQSRFLALVSSYDRLKELSETAANSEDAAQLQFLKTLDSVDAKIQQLQTSLQALYVDTGLEDAYKGILDWLNNIAITLNNLPDLFGLPIPAIIKLGTTFASVANIVVTTFALLKAQVKAIELSITKDTTAQMNTLNANSTETRKAQEASVTAAFKTQSEIRVQTFINELERMQAAYQSMRLGNGVGTLPPGVTQTYLTDGSSGGSTSGGGTGGGLTGIAKGVTKGWAIGGLITSIVGTILSGVADNINEKTQENRNTKAAMTAGSNILQGAGLGMTVGGLKGALIGGSLGLVKGAFEAIGIATESTDEKIQNLNSTLEDTSNARIKSEDDLKTLTNYKKKYDELYKARNSSNEAYAEYIALNQEIAANYPTLISGMDDENNYLVTLTDDYEALLAAKRAVYNADFIKEGAAQIKAYSDRDFINTMLGVAAEGSYDPNREGTGFAGAWADISSAFADNKLIGSITHYLGGLTASDWSNTSYKDILTAAWNSTNYTDRLATGSLQHDYDTLFGVHPKQGNVGFYFGNEEGTKRWVEEYQLKHSSYDEGKYSGDIIPAIAESVIGYIGEELDKGTNIGKMQSHLQEYFGQEFNLNKLFGSIATNNATAESRDTYIEKIVRGLNTTATKNSIEELGLDTDSIQMSFLTKSIQKKWEAEWSEALKNDPNADMGTVWTSFMLRMNTEVEELFNGDELKSFYKNLTQDQIKKANKYYTEVGQYSYDALTTILEKAGYGPDLTKFITDHLTESAQTAITHFKTGMQELDTGYKITTADGETLSNLANSFSELFGADFLEGIYNNYSSILEDTSLSNKMKQTRITDLTAIYKTVGGLKNATMRSKVMPLIDNADLTTLDGIYKLVEELEQIEGLNLDTTGLRDAIDQWKSNLKINLTTELQLIIDNYTTHIADLEKDLSSASKGMDFKNAAELAAKLGKSLSDFRYEVGKFYYDDVDAIIEYYDLENETLLKDLQSEIDTRKTALGGRFTVTRSISTDKPTIDWKAWEDIYNILDDEDATLEQFEAALEPYKAFLEDQGLYDSLTYMFNHRGFQDHYIAGTWDSRELTSWTENYWESIKSKWEGIPEAIDTQFTESLDEIFIKADGSLKTVLAEINTMNLDNIEGITKEDLITLATLYMQRTGDDVGLSFSTWLEQYYTDLWNDYADATTKYTQGVKARTFLNQGNLTAFLDTIINKDNISETVNRSQEFDHATQAEIDSEVERRYAERKNQFINAIKTSDWATLGKNADIAPYLDELYNLYESINKNVMDSVMKGLKSGSYITSTDVNDYKFEELVSKGLLKKVGDHLYQVVGDYAKARAEVLASDLDEETKAGYLKQIFEEQHKDKINPLSNLLDKSGVSYDAAEAFAESLGRSATEAEAVMEEYDFKLNKQTGKYEATTKTYSLLRSRIAQLESDPQANREELNRLRAMVDDLEKQEKRRTTAAAFTDVFSNYDKITTESAAALATALGTTYENVVQTYLIDNGNGTFSLDMSKVQLLLQEGRAIIGDALYNELLDQVAEFYDDGLTAIADASSFVSQGTDKATDMQKFVTDFNEKTSSNYSISDMFKWDDVLETYTLKSEYLQEYIEAQKAALKQQGFDDKFIEKYIDKQVEEIRNAVNISDFYSAEVRGQGSKARRTLESAMKASLAAQEEFETENYGYYLKIAESEVGANTVEAKYIADAYLANAQAHNAARQAVIDSQVADDIAALEAGDQAAIDVMRKYAEDGELTADQVEQAYKQRFTNLSNVMEALDGLQKNSVVDATTRDILNQIPGFKVNSDGVVEKVGDLVTAYTELYTQMQSNTVATTSELNAAYAKVLTAGEQKDIDAVSALENAMGMTYDALGSLLANYGTNLKYVADHWEEYGISQIGNGKIRINDFEVFAANVGLTDITSEEYISAFKTYNDSLIALDRSTQQNILDELTAITEAKPGSRINLTTIASKLHESLVNAVIGDLGGYIQNGILTLGEDANVAGIIDNIVRLVQHTNDETIMLAQNELDTLADTLAGLIGNINSLISSGISGSLTNSQVSELRKWATDNGLKNIDFVSTAEGFQLTEDAAFELYGALNDVSALSASKLLPTIQGMNKQYNTLEGTMKAYEEAVEGSAKKIALAAMITQKQEEPESFKFMQNSMPESWQSIFNYASDYYTATQTIKTSSKTGTMDMESFYNIMAEIEGYNAGTTISGKSTSEWMSSIGNFFTTDKSGNPVFDLSKAKLSLKELQTALNEAVAARSKIMSEYNATKLTLAQGAESFDFNKLLGIDGTLDMSKVTELLGASEQFAAAMDQITLNINGVQGSLKDLLTNNPELVSTDLLTSILQNYGNIDWESTDLTTAIQQLLGEWGKDTTVEVEANGEIKIAYTYRNDQIVPTYKIGDHILGEGNEIDPEELTKAYGEFISAKNMEGATIVDNTDSATIDFTLAGREVDFNIEYATGKTLYEITLSDGTVLTAPSMEGIKQAIAYANIVDPITDETIESSAKDHATFTINKGGISIDVKLENGQIQSANGIIDSQEKAQLLNELQGQLDKSLEDTPIQTTVTSLEVALGEGASITMAKTNEDGSITVELTDAATGEVKTFTIGAIEQALLSDSAKTAIQNAIDTYTAEVKSKLNLTGAKSDLEKWNPTKTIKTDLKFGLSGVNLAKGNVALAAGNQALARGTRSTLMGELGPELWVSGGHYYVAGRSGAEFVDLPNDAIVFNHLQTRKLLGTGSSGRGKPITSEQTAVAMAHGNLSGGPAREIGWLESIIAAWNALWGIGTKGSNGSTSGSTSGSTAPTGLTDDQKSKLSTLLSDALSKGFENLDWSDYEDELGSMMDEIKNTARINYRTFIDTYASQCDKTTSEINELYFQAWQKDLEDSMDSEDIVSAAEGLNFYANGSIGGSASDWQSIIGDRALITDLVKKGIMSYDAATKQYFVTNAEALANAGVDISQIEGIQEMIYDSLRSQYDQIVDYISNGLEGSLTAMDSKSLQSLVERMGITDLQLDFEQTVNGLKLSQESAISLYNELKKVDSIAAQLTFNELVENLQESNDNYKTMTSLLTHIYDLTDKISQTDKYSDTKIKQYQEELSLAKQIAAVRATTDEDSFSWYDEELPAGMNNPLNYISSWQDSIEMLRDASESGVADFKGMVNTAKQINAQAKALNTTLSFCGYELDGSTEALDAIITAMAGSLGSVTTDSGTNFGVVLEKMGADITDGASSYENSATSAMQTMAQAQIQILDGLIATFEMLAALEGLEKIDLNLDEKIDLEELFDLTTDVGDLGVKLQDNAATAIGSILEANDEIAEQLKTVTYGSYTLYDLFKDASDGYLNAEIAKEDFLKLVQALYELALGDYDPDNIAGSLYDKLATLDLTQTLTLGDYTINVKYSDYKVTQTDDGKWKTTTKGTSWDTFDEAVRAEALESAGVTGTITWSEDKVTASGALSFKSVEMTVVADAEGTHYDYNGNSYPSLEAAAKQAWTEATNAGNTTLSFDAWQIEQGITLIPTIDKVDASKLSRKYVENLVGKSLGDLELDYTLLGDLEFKAKYGFEWDPNTSEEDLETLKAAAGITTEAKELVVDLKITNLEEIKKELGEVTITTATDPNATGSATVTADTTEAVASISAVEEAINKAIKAIEYLNTLKVAIDKGTAEADMQAIEKATKDAETAIGSLNSAVSSLTSQFGGLNSTLNTLQGYLSSLSNSTISINAVGHEVLNTIATDLHSIWEDIKNLKDKEVNGQIVLNITTGGGSEGVDQATGNVIGNGAFAAGSRQVLMGELGPELYVTGGRYYVAGQSGAEFVNLPNDAIVFNHLQTRKLLSTGAAGRGKPVTNEKAATSLATGNAMGLAMANVQQTLATLKQLRAMWQSIANASITDMVGLANMKDTESSSDSGGNKIDRKAWIETLEKWYNWLQKIAELEKEINYEEQLRNTLETRQGPKGKELYESQKRELEMIKQQYAVQKSLVDSRREYFEARRAQLNSSVFGKFYQFDEHGQQFYTRGTKFEFGKTADYVAAQKAAQASGGNGATTTAMTNVAPEMTKHTAEWNKSIENLALAIYNTRASNQASRLSDGSISYKLNHYETIDKALQMAQTMYRIDENGKATYLGNSTAKGDPLAYSDVSGRLWNIWEQNIGVEFDRLQSGEKQRSNMDQNALNASSEYKKLLSQTIQDTAKVVGQEVGGGSTGGGTAGANPPRSELAQITQIEGGFAALMELWARDPQTLEPKYTPAEQYAIAQSLGFGNYMLYDQSGNKIEPGENGQDDTFYTSALQALTDNLDADREEMQSLYDSIEEDEKKLLELEQKQNEILLAIRDNQIDVENKILDAIEAREQAIIDELSDTKEVLEDNADKYINGLNEALSNEQRMYQSNKSQNELESLRRQLAILQRSGGSASQINSLQQQIDAKEQENYFDAQQQQIDAIQAASDLEIERLDKQIEIMETTLEYSKEHGLLWAEVSQIMQQDDGVIMDFLLSNTAEYLASSALQQSATYDELLSMVNQWTAYRDDQNKYRPLQEDMEVGLEDIMANIFSTDANVEDSNVISAIIGANAQVVQGIQAATEATKSSSSGSSSGSSGGSYSYDERGSGGSISGASKAGSAVGGTGNAEYNAWLREQGNNLGVSANWQMAIAEGGKYKDEDKYKINATQTGQQAAKTLEKAGEGNGTWTFTRDFVYDTSNDNGKNYSKWELGNIETDLKNLKDPNGIYKDMSEAWKQNKINVYTEVLRQNGVPGYSSGGSVDYTGLAMVHGTPTRPEYFLDAEETKMWKSDILSANSSSLTSRLLALREILNGIESASSHINNSIDNGVIIEKAEVNVDVAQLANDYDARRAGDTIMDEILQIARKTGVSSVRR